MSDTYNLNRFISAQERTYDHVSSELRNGQKESHWMWYVFPQIKGLGFSSKALTYSISGVAEAKEYMGHPILADRLTECCNILLELEGRSPQDIFGITDAMKLHSSMTLFARVSCNPVFTKVLSKYYDGREDPNTVNILTGTHFGHESSRRTR